MNCMSDASFRSRHQKGAPSSQGGRFREEPKGESLVSLQSGTGPRAEARARRREALLLAGYLPAVPSTDFTVPEFSGKRDQWWDRQFQAAEYQPDGAGYPLMPDDYTPKFSTGGSLSGHRRTHRILYQGAGVALRIPSATAIKRYSAETGSTFDVPVSAAFPGGTVIGTVRVTHNGAGFWSVSGNGFTPEQSAYVCEGVSAVLEARRPSTGLKQAGDLLERRRKRFAAGGVKFDETPQSSFISGVGYDRSTGTMLVRIGARSYGYQVPEASFNQVRASRDPGKAYNALVKGRRRAEVDSCPKCHRFFAAGVEHRCPSKHQAPGGLPREQNLAARNRAREIASD